MNITYTIIKANANNRISVCHSPIRVKLSPIRLVPKLQLGNGIARKVGQASSPDIIMTSGNACPT